MRRFLTWFLILSLLGGVAAAGTVGAASWWKQRNAPKYLTAKVSRGPVETVVNSTGTVKPVRTVSIGAFTSGPIASIKVDFNSEITEKGQLLALIDARLPAAVVERDSAAVATQEADKGRLEILHKQAVNNEERARNLRKANEQYLSATDMEQYETTTATYVAQLKLADASIRQAKATLQNSKDQLSYTEIRAPDEIDPARGIKGKVIERKVDPGQTVAASFQTPELFIIGLEMDKHMHVYASVDEADIGLIQTTLDRQRREVYAVGAIPGSIAVAGVVWRQRPRAKFTVDSHPGELFEGRIHEIRLNSTTTQNVVTYPVIIEASNPGEKLKPNMTANISFRIDAKNDVLRIPAAALRFVPLPVQVRPEDRPLLEALPASSSEGAPKRTAGEKAEQARSRQRRLVWVQDDGAALLRAVPVTLGLMENQFAEVVSGDLREGQAVVTGVDNTR